MTYLDEVQEMADSLGLEIIDLDSFYEIRDREGTVVFETLKLLRVDIFLQGFKAGAAAVKKEIEK